MILEVAGFALAYTGTPTPEVGPTNGKKTIKKNDN